MTTNNQVHPEATYKGGDTSKEFIFKGQKWTYDGSHYARLELTKGVIDMFFTADQLNKLSERAVVEKIEEKELEETINNILNSNDYSYLSPKARSAMVKEEEAKKGGTVIELEQWECVDPRDDDQWLLEPEELLEFYGINPDLVNHCPDHTQWSSG